MTKPDPPQENNRSWKRRGKKSVQRPGVVKEPDVEINFKAGDFVGEHRIVEELGRGAFGLVCLGIGPEGGEVALKTFLGPTSSKELREGFKREAAVWAGLGGHPYIVAAYGVAERGSRPFVVLEFVRKDEQGRNTLEHHLWESVGLKQALKWAIEFCQGMEHAASHGVACHGDIKPSNIMIAPDGTLKIADFGLANFWKSKAALAALKETVQRGGRGMSVFRSCAGTKMAGTPAYMAPEQFRGKADIRSDIYSFGIVLCQMQNGGMHPFGVLQSLDAWRDAHDTGVVAPLDTPLSPVIEKSLKKLPRDRYQGFEQVRAELEEMWKDRFPPKSHLDVAPSEMTEGVRRFVVGYVEATFGEGENAKKEFVAAEKAYKRACDLDPNSPHRWSTLGFARFNQEDFVGAEEAFQHACDLDANHSKSWWGLGMSRGQQRNYTGAEEACKRACDLCPNSPERWRTLGHVRIALENYSGAEEAFQRACALDPNNPEHWGHLGDARFRLIAPRLISAFHRAPI